MINIEIIVIKGKVHLTFLPSLILSDSFSKEEIYRTGLESSNFYIFCKYINILKRSSA